MAGTETDRGRQRDFFGVASPSDRIEPDPRFGEVAKIGTHPIHCFRAKCLDTSGFQGIEHRTSIAIRHRCPQGMKLGIVVKQPQCQRVRGTTRFGHQTRFERRPRRYHPGHLAGRLTGGIRCEHHLGLWVMRNCPRRAGQHSAKTIEGCGNSHRLITL